MSTTSYGAPKTFHKPFTPSPTPYMSRNFTPVVTSSTIPGFVLPIKCLTPIEMQAHREKGLCYNCDKIYSFGQRYKCKQLFMITSKTEDLDESEQSTETVHLPNCWVELASYTSDIAISSNALSGNVSFQTLKL